MFLGFWGSTSEAIRDRIHDTELTVTSKRLSGLAIGKCWPPLPHSMPHTLITDRYGDVVLESVAVHAGPGSPVSKEDMLARIARAKQYKEGANVAPSSGADTAFSVPAPSLTQWQPSRGDAATPSPPSPAQPSDLSETGTSAPQAAPDSPPSGVSASFQQYEATGSIQSQEEYVRMMMESRRGGRAGAGSADQAAAWLQGVLKDDGGEARSLADQFTRMEEFSDQQEANKRAAGADIIVGGMVGVRGQAYGEAASAAAAASAAGAVVSQPTTPSDAASISSAPATMDVSSPAPTSSATDGGGDLPVGYQPTVSTWGVFPRPKDISKTYGGGRNIKPGQEYETPEQKAARELAFRTAMLQYKKAIGAEVDPAVEAAASALLAEGNKLMSAGSLQLAYAQFESAAAMVPVKTKVGGEATLQKAICADSLGDSKAAERLYRTLLGHPQTFVSKKARQLLFGFQAMAFLKADKFSYAARSGDFDGFFRKITDRTRVYVQTEEDRVSDEAQARVATQIAFLVLVGPVAVFALLAFTRAA